MIEMEADANRTEGLVLEKYADSNRFGYGDATKLLDRVDTRNDPLMAESYNLIVERIDKEDVKMEKWDTYDLNTELNLEKIKSKICEDKFHDPDATQLYEEVDIKNESISEEQIMQQEGHVLHNSSERVSFSCYHCDYTVYRKVHLIRHMKVHQNSKTVHRCNNCNYKTYLKKLLAVHMRVNPTNAHVRAQFNCNDGKLLSMSPQKATSNLKNCRHCNASFKSKQMVDDHILRAHPKSIASVTSKIHECGICIYKSTIKSAIDKHMSIHSNSIQMSKAASSTFRTCLYCNATFKSKRVLDDHTLKKHPELIASVTSNIIECNLCVYKTTMKARFDEHMLKHKRIHCIHCNAVFRRNNSMNNHILKEHPEFVASITTKIHECELCMYKTTTRKDFIRHRLKHPEAHFTCQVHECKMCKYKTIYKQHFNRHMMLRHSDSDSSCNFCTCTHCGTAYKSKQALDDHVLKKHPDLTASVTTKIHECNLCVYKTSRKYDLDRHMLNHPGANSSFKFCNCMYCNATFRDKRSMDNHIMRKHPECIASVTSKIFRCKLCIYKTINKNNLDKHILTHSAANNLHVHKSKVLKTEDIDLQISQDHPEFITSIESWQSSQ